jgi:hypothetical protein
MAEGQQQTAVSQPTTQAAQQSQKIADVIRGYRPCKVGQPMDPQSLPMPLLTVLI